MENTSSNIVNVVMIPRDYKNIYKILVPMAIIVKSFPLKSCFMSISTSNKWLSNEKNLEDEIADIKISFGVDPLTTNNVNLYLVDIHPDYNVACGHNLWKMAIRNSNRINLWISPPSWPDYELETMYQAVNYMALPYGYWLHALEEAGYHIPEDFQEIHEAFLFGMPEMNPRANRLHVAWELGLTQAKTDEDLINTAASMVMELVTGIKQPWIKNILKE